MNPLAKQFALLALGSLATGLLLASLFPKMEWAGMAWLALTPLLYVLRGGKSALTAEEREGGAGEYNVTRMREAFGWGWLSGFIYFVISLSWIGHVTVGGVLILALYLGIGMGLWSMVVTLQWRRNQILSSVSNLQFALSAAAAWVILEWVKGHLFSGFPWNNLGVSLYRNLPMIQIADHFGVYGLSFMIVFVNVILLLTIMRLNVEIRMMIRQRNDFQLFRLRPHLDFTVGMAMIMVSYGYGMVCLFESHPIVPVKLRIALVQGNIPQDQKWDNKRFYSILDTYTSLTESAALAKPDLLVWPESATPDGYLENKEVFEAIGKLTADNGYTFIFGSNDLVDGKDYTGAFLIGPRQSSFEYYHKMHLVPYGEYVPLRDWMPWLRKVVPIGDGFYPGKDPKVFVVGPDNLRIAPLVCFEDLFPSISQQRVLIGCDAFVNLTNGGWYGESSGIYQHLANSVFRSIETRRPMIRATNTGMTCWIDPKGRIRDAFAPFVAGFQICVVDIYQNAPVTFYARHGDIFVVFCLLVLILALARSLLWQWK
ncbi:MAG: apolipoprotein N-acyltransferase [Verrucomicrobiota bacterium]|nr:apolipoprotein N-acyltransferase [Verrucomicrobiota bacterium]